MAAYIETIKRGNLNTYTPDPDNPSQDDKIYPRTIVEAVYFNDNQTLVAYLNKLKVLYEVQTSSNNTVIKLYLDTEPFGISDDGLTPTTVNVYQENQGVISFLNSMSAYKNGTQIVIKNNSTTYTTQYQGISIIAAV